MSDLTDMAERSMFELEIDEAGQGSSEETLQGATNVSTKSFSHIASCQLLMQKQSGARNTLTGITAVVLLPDNQAVTCDPSARQLKILDEDMETKVNLQLKYQNKVSILRQLHYLIENGLLSR